MWQLVRAGVENGQLVLVPASKEPIDIGTITTVAGVSGGVHVHTYLREVRAQAYRVFSEGKMTHTQSTLLLENQFSLFDSLKVTVTNAADMVVYSNSFAGTGTTTTPAPHATLSIFRREWPNGEMKPDTLVSKWEADSFGQLCAKHPDEVKKYIEPLFHDLNLGGVFFVDPTDAQHAFSGLVPLDPKIVAKVQTLLPRLDDDSPEVRTAAEAELKALGDAGVAPVKAIDLTKQPHQTSVTLRNFLEATGAVAEEPRLSNPDYLLLCLALDDKQIPALAKARLEKQRGKPVDVDLAAPVDERRKLVRKMLFDQWASAQPPQTQK